MIVETAIMTVQPGREDEFVLALERARDVLSEAQGWRDLRAHRGVERPSSFLLVLTWETLEDHTVGFRGGELFARWRSILGPYFAEQPTVEHWSEL